MSYEFITVERDGPVTLFTLNRPEVMNACHSPMHFEMDDAINKFAADPEQWVGIITGAGDRAFRLAMTSSGRPPAENANCLLYTSPSPRD